jgi:hypothetical protein
MGAGRSCNVSASWMQLKNVGTQLKNKHLHLGTSQRAIKLFLKLANVSFICRVY